MKVTTTLSTLLFLSLGGACASEEPKDSNTQTASKSRALRSAEATSKLMSLSNSSAGLNKIGTRSSITATELIDEIQSGVTEFTDALVDPTCAEYTLETIDESNIELHFDFSDCDVDGGIDDITGELDVGFTIDEVDGEVDCAFDGDLGIDGYGFDGTWDVDLDGSGGAEIAGVFDVVLPDGVVLPTTIDASWEGLDDLCPSLTQHLDIQSGVDALGVDLSGINLCGGDLCGSGVNIAIDGLEGVEGVEEIDFSEYEDAGNTEDLFCDEDGDLSDFELPEELPEGV